MVDYVVLDTDVASLSFRRRLPAAMIARLTGRVWCLTFVTVGELTQWMRLRNWSARNQTALEAWLSGFALVDSSHQAAQIWGHAVGRGQAPRSLPADQRHLDRRLLSG